MDRARAGSAAGAATATGTAAAPAVDFTTVYRAHRDEATRLAFLLSHDSEVAEEAVADAFFKIYRRWDSGDIAAPRAYIRRAVANEVATGFRRRTRRRRELPPTPLAAFGPEDRYADFALLRDALALLPPRQRAVVVLRYYHDLSEAEVADRLGIQVGTVKSAGARGLAALRARMAAPDADAA